MIQDVLFRTEIPFFPQWLAFKQWSPSEEDSIVSGAKDVVSEKDLSLKLWFDNSCMNRLGGEIVNANKMFADVTVKDVPDELVGFIRESGETLASEKQDLADKNKKLGERVYSFTLKNVNRFISYFRTEKGQYWLQKLEYNEANILFEPKRFEFKVIIDGAEECLWKVGPDLRIGIKRNYVETFRLIDRDTWSEAKKFLASSDEPSLILELLAGRSTSRKWTQSQCIGTGSDGP